MECCAEISEGLFWFHKFSRLITILELNSIVWIIVTDCLIICSSNFFLLVKKRIFPKEFQSSCQSCTQGFILKKTDLLPHFLKFFRWDILKRLWRLVEGLLFRQSLRGKLNKHGRGSPRLNPIKVIVLSNIFPILSTIGDRIELNLHSWDFPI